MIILPDYSIKALTIWLFILRTQVPPRPNHTRLLSPYLTSSLQIYYKKPKFYAKSLLGNLVKWILVQTDWHYLWKRRSLSIMNKVLKINKINNKIHPLLEVNRVGNRSHTRTKLDYHNHSSPTQQKPLDNQIVMLTWTIQESQSIWGNLSDNEEPKRIIAERARSTHASRSRNHQDRSQVETKHNATIG